MASNINTVTIEGHLGKVPYLKEFRDGGSMVAFSVACSQYWKSKEDGEWKESTTWVQVKSYSDALNKHIMENATVGSHVIVMGQLKEQAKPKDSEIKFPIYYVAANSVFVIAKRVRNDEQKTKTESEKRGKPQGNSDLDDEIPF